MAKFGVEMLALVLGMSMLVVGVYSVETMISSDTKVPYIVITTDMSQEVGPSLSSTSTADVYLAMVQKAQQATSTGSVSTAGTEEQASLTYEYTDVTKGFSTMMTAPQALYLQSMPGVLAVYVDRPIHPDTTRTPEFLGLSTVKGLWPKAKLGADVIIGVLDTGIWPESASFSDVGYGPIPARWKGICQVGTRFSKANCNKKLIGARYGTAHFR